jgi:histidyl-tRNA synthetase
MDMFQAKPTGSPAVGISLGVDRLLSALLDLGLVAVATAPADAFFCLFDAGDYPHVAAVANQLRAEGVRIECALSAGKLGKQFQLATRKGYRWALLQGVDERSRGEVVVKDLVAGTQEVLSLAAIGEWKGRLTGR